VGAFISPGREILGSGSPRRINANLIPKEIIMETTVKNNECQEEPRILDEIHVEELAIDGICGVY
jgi:mycofactocin precursor